MNRAYKEDKKATVTEKRKNMNLLKHFNEGPARLLNGNVETSIEIKRWGNILPNGCMKQETLRMFAKILNF